MEQHQDAAERIIIALDVKTTDEATRLVEELREAVVFKVGLELFTAEGPPLLRELKRLRKEVFLDLKLHDIPNTVAQAVRSGARYGVRMMTLHASGGAEMMKAAALAAHEAAVKERKPRLALLAVTVLTSLKDEDLKKTGVSDGTAGQVRRLAALAKEAGMDGIVSSPREIEVVREAAPGLIVVTPGIRPAWAAADDQKRIMTPAEAVGRGADYIVIGRPVTKADSPRKAFLKIVKEIEEARSH